MRGTARPPPAEVVDLRRLALGNTESQRILATLPLLDASPNTVLFLAPRFRDLVVERLDEIRHDGALARLNKALDRHAGDELEALEA